MASLAAALPDVSAQARARSLAALLGELKLG